MWLWVLIVVALTSTGTQGLYTDAEIQNIVRELAMPFWSFARPGWQYGVLLLLPAGKKTHDGREGIHLVPTPADRNANGQYTTYNQRLLKRGGNVLVGFNYAVARPSDDKTQHTETLLLSELPGMLDLVHRYGVQPTVLLYTRATPCKTCTSAINKVRIQYYGRLDQIVVAYSFNTDNQDYMTPEINCEQRQELRSFNVQVMCVREQYANARQNQCIENDNISCSQHNQRFSTPAPRKS